MCVATLPYNILILVNVRWWNANAFYAVNVARIFARRGHRVWVGCGKHTPAYAKANQWGLTAVDLDFQARNPLRLVWNFWRLLKFIRHNGIQVVNSHRPEDSTFGWLAQILSGVGHVVTRSDQRPIGRGWVGQLRYHRADAVVLTCKALLERNRAILDPIRSKVTVIHGSVDEDRFKPGTPLSTTPDTLRVGWVGRLDPVKDPSTFLRAAAQVATQCPEVEFVMAASPANLDRDAIVRQAVRLGLESRLTLLPRVTNIALRMAAMDLGVITSIDSEVISRVLLEFLALGKPVIGTRVNAIGEIIRPGVNGELFTPGDHRALARLIIAWARDPRLRRTYADGVQQTYTGHYTAAEVYRQYREVLAKAIS